MREVHETHNNSTTFGRPWQALLATPVRRPCWQPRDQSLRRRGQSLRLRGQGLRLRGQSLRLMGQSLRLRVHIDV